MVSHAALLDAVQAASGSVAVTATVPVLAPLPTFADGGINVNVAAAPACVIVNVCPAMVKVPAIWLAEVFDGAI